MPRLKILGAELATIVAGVRAGTGTVVLLGEDGSVAELRRPSSLPQAAQDVAELAGEDPFLLGVDLPLVVPERAVKARPVESLVKRRLGHRLPPGGRAALSTGRGGVGGEALLQALAVAGHPCLPYPDRDRRRSGLAEVYPALVLKVLLWEGSPAAASPNHPDREKAFRAYEPPAYRLAAARDGWAERAFALDLVLRGLGFHEGIDLRGVWEAVAGASSDEQVERAGALLDAVVVAVAAKRYLEEPEASVFLGDRESGYTILPADGFVRRLSLREAARPSKNGLFPRESLRERLGEHAELRPMALVEVPGRAQRFEAVFAEPPLYEFDNLDEMLWWKHCRHLVGPELPIEGLGEMIVRVGTGDGASALRLVRSRHRTLSFRFDPPDTWRSRIATRDGKTYPFRVLRAVYETLPAGD